MLRRLRGLLRKPSRTVTGKRRPTKQLTHEALEDRCLLATGPLISEFMAVNDSTLADEDGEFSDWIEIHNPTETAVDLTGWHLTDDATELDKWTFSTLSLDPGEFQVVFASGKDRTNPISELHTNFNLAASGEYLALVQPDLTPAHAYAPAYPQQEPDLSYGVIFDGFRFISAGAPVEVHVPQDDSLGMTWTDPFFTVDEESWIDGATGVGFGLSVSGLTVDYYKANISVGSLGDAESVIANTSQQSNTATEIAPVINYLNTNSGAHYSGDAPFPTLAIGNDVDDFVIEATGTVIIPAAGQWTFGVNSDDGFSLDLDNGTNSFSMSFPNPRAPGDTLSTFNITQAGPYDLRLVMYERGGGAEVEMYAAQGSYGSWNSTNFDLVGDTSSGGLEVFTSPDGGGGGSSIVRTDIQATMLGVNSSAYLRVPFTVTDAAELDSLSLQMKYNDGFVAYLNGSEIVRRNAPAGVSWNSSAIAARSQQDTLVAEVINLSGSLGLLTDGLNVLSIHGLNVTASDDTFLISPELVGGGVLASDPLYFADPTPGTINSTASFGIVADTKFSVDRGFYDAPLQVEITSDTVDATIRYTTDGSEPTETQGSVYSGPIDISTTTALRAAAFKPGFQSTNVDTQTYVFVDDVIGQPNNPAGFPTSWGGTSADYGMDPDITNNPAYAATLGDDLKSLPVMSITMDVDDLFGSGGIYSNSTSQGVAWERAASLEYFEPNGSDDFQVNAGIRMYGGVGRNGQYKKHSFRFLFKGQYGATKLRFPLFGDEATDRFDTIILRSNFNDAWVWGGNESQFVRDEFAGRLQLAMGEPGRHGNFVHLYINGLYWGLYNPVERPDTAFSATYSGGEKENWDGINSGNPTGESQTAAWNTLMNMASGLGSNTEYQRVQGNNLDGTNNPGFEDYLDIDNYITYLLVNFFGGNNDWVTHNWYAGRLRGPESSGFKSYSWDAEWIVDMRSGLNDNAVNDTTTNNHLLKPYTYLRNNAEFRLRFADHIHQHMFNDGVLTPAATDALYRSLVDQIEAAVVAESARWGDVVSASPFTPQDWTSERDYVLNTYLPQRSSIVLQQLKNAGLYPDIAAPALNVNGVAQHGGTIQQGDSLTLSASSGTIYYTTDGSDPRALYGGISPDAQAYAGSIPLNEAVRIRARVLSGGDWSAVSDAIFILDTPPPLRITEIMYNPAPADVANGELNVDNDRFEYIELKNVGTDPIDVTNLSFTDGIEFDFATSDITTISPEQHVVVVRDLAAFQSRYGTSISVAGEFANDTALRNSGEQIRLESVLGQVFHDFDYNDVWFSNTDGGGFSLTILDENASVGTWDKQEGWRPSAVYNGSPGTDDDALAPGSVVINELLTHTDSANGDWIELVNTTGSPIDIGGWFVSDSASDLTKYQIASGTIINPGQYLVFTSTSHFGNAADPGANILFGFSELGEEAHVSSLDPTTGGPGSYRVMVDFAGADQEVSFGRLENSAFYKDLVATTAPTQGTANAPPVVPELVLNEIMYHPALGVDEYIELYNRGAAAVNLYDPSNPANTWRFTNGVTFDFPTGVTVAAGEHILVVPVDPETFRTSHGLSAGVQIFGPYVGSLENAGEVLELSRPGVPNPPPESTVPYIVNERVRFNDKAPWPVTADGNGPSLSRAVVDQWGNEPANWSAGTNGGTPGAANLFTDATPPTAPSGLSATVGVSGLFELNWNAAADAQSGIGLYHIYRDGQDIGTSTTTNFTDASINFTAPHTYEISAENGDGLEGPLSASLSTQVTGFQNGMLPSGAYVGTADTELREANPTSNQGDDTNLEIDGEDSGVDLWVLLKWQLTNIPANATILGASLTLNVTNASNGPYFVYEMKRDWVESEATWQQYGAGQSWQTSGGQGSNDRGTTPVGTMNFGSTGQQTINLTAEGLTLLQDWITGAKPNHGFILGNTSNTNGLDFDSREVASVGNRPKLSISYITGTGKPPTVNDQTFAVDENSAAGTSVGTVTATDPDAGDTLTYAITGGIGATAFSINANSGTITVTNANQLDFEANTSFSLTVRVMDSGGLSDSGTMTVDLNDVNEAPSVNNQIFTLVEHSADGTFVGTVAGADPDAGDTLSFDITGGSGASVFQIDDSSGDITVADFEQLDFETNPSIGLIIRVTDTGALFDTGTITINLIDQAEPPADFNRNGHIDCQDADALIVEIVSGNNSAAFDLTNDGVVNRDDLALWLEQAGAANLASGNAYLPGDANLDGVVDGVDFGIWQENRFTSVASWCAGDFNADSFVDVADFNIWNDHRFMSALEMPAAAAANEPPTDAPRAPLAVQHLATHDLALPISAQVIRARSTSTINGNDATSDGWPQVDHDGVLFTGRDSRERQLDTLFAQIGRTRAVPKVSSAGILDSFWKELFVDLSFISQFRDEVINQRA